MIRLIAALFLSILFFIFVIQNLRTVELNFLIWKFNGSLALILLLTFVIAIIVSLLVSIPVYLKRWSGKSSDKKTGENPKLNS